MQQLCVALFNYNATKPDELSLKPGIVIKVIKSANDGWQYGVCSSEHGWFPSNFVAIPEDVDLTNCQLLRYGRAMYDYSPQEPDELLLKTNDVITILDTAEDDGWLRGIVNGKLGLFPENFIKIVTDSGEDAQQKDVVPGHRRSSLAPGAAIKLAESDLKPKLCTAIVTFDYIAQQLDELQLKKGQILDVLEKDDDGWWKGRDAAGKVGVFPFNFVRELMSMEERKQITTNKLITKSGSPQLTQKAKTQPPQTSPKPAFLKNDSKGDLIDQPAGNLPPLTKNRVSLQARKRAPSIGTKGVINEKKEQYQVPVQQQNSLENTLVAPEERSQDVTLVQYPQEQKSIAPIHFVSPQQTQMSADSANVTLIQEATWVDPKEEEPEEDYIANYASNISLNGIIGSPSSTSNLKASDMNSISKATLVTHSPEKTLFFNQDKSAETDNFESMRNFINMELNNIRVQFENALNKERDQRLQLQKEVNELKKRM